MVTGLTNGTPYTFRVSATNAIGTSEKSELTSSVTPTISVPSAPTSLAVSSFRRTYITLTFTQPSDGGSAILNYKYSIDNGVSYTECDPSDNAIPITINGLTENTEYTIRLVAVNAIGDSPASDGLTVSTVTGLPDGIQLLQNPDFTSITNNGADNWTSSRGWERFVYDANDRGPNATGTTPTAQLTLPTNRRPGVLAIADISTGYVLFSYVSATVSQTVNNVSSALVGKNQITGVLNIVNSSNGPNIDTFIFKIDFKDSAGNVVHTTTTGSIPAPSTWTDYTLTQRRDTNRDFDLIFDLITSIEISITGIDAGFWVGHYGPAIDYCSLIVS